MLNVIIYFRSEEGKQKLEDVPKEERREIMEKKIDLGLSGSGLPFERDKTA